MKKVYSYDEVLSYFKKADTNPYSVLDANWQNGGYASEYEMARVLITLIQNEVRRFEDPVIFAGLNTFLFMQRNDQLTGFLTKCFDFIHVGDLSTGRQTIVVSKQIEQCGSCGNPEPQLEENALNAAAVII